MDAATLQALVDRQAIVDTVVRYAWALDRKDWDLARACFADEVEADYGDLRGRPPERITAEEFVRLRREALASLATHHLSANHLVSIEGDRATCVSAFLIHRLAPAPDEAPSEVPRTFDSLGHYVHGLVRGPGGWRIARVTQTVAWNRGDPALHPGARGGHER